MAQTGSLVYYGVHANDVFAYFLTAIAQVVSTHPDYVTRDAGTLNLVSAFAASTTRSCQTQCHGHGAQDVMGRR